MVASKIASMIEKNTLKINSKRLSFSLLSVGMTRTDLAKCLGLNRSDLWRRVTGRTTWSIAEAHLVSELLEVSQNWLFSAGEVEIEKNSARNEEQNQ